MYRNYFSHSNHEIKFSNHPINHTDKQMCSLILALCLFYIKQVQIAATSSYKCYSHLTPKFHWLRVRSTARQLELWEDEIFAVITESHSTAASENLWCVDFRPSSAHYLATTKASRICCRGLRITGAVMEWIGNAATASGSTHIDQS